MKVLLTLLFSISVFLTGCSATEEQDMPKGTYIIRQKQQFFLKNDSISQTFDKESVPEGEAYVYDFSQANKVLVSNIAKEFSWEFDLTKDRNTLVLENVHGDAEDDVLHFSWEDGKLILTRDMEDADSDDDNSSIVVRTVQVLEKVK